MRLLQSIYFVIAVTVILAACASPAVPGNPPTPEPSPGVSPQPLFNTPSTGVATLTERAILDLADRLSVSPAVIDVVSEEDVVWPNAGLGCPQPGLSYTEVQLDGLRIILSHGGVRYEYHAGAERIILCETDRARVELTAVPLPTEPAEEIIMTTTPVIEPGMESLIAAATADLMKRLSVTRDAIEVVSAKSVVWPDRSLGCPQPGMMYPQVLAEGYRIELRAKNQIYVYHGGEGRGPFLCENPPK
jgi:hypothetical protein